jgi:hypothetical protein
VASNLNRNNTNELNSQGLPQLSTTQQSKVSRNEIQSHIFSNKTVFSKDNDLMPKINITHQEEINPMINEKLTMSPQSIFTKKNGQ